MAIGNITHLLKEKKKQKKEQKKKELLRKVEEAAITGRSMNQMIRLKKRNK